MNSEAFKFSCAHFVAYQGFRERLHGHNYTVDVHLNGETTDEGISALNNDGYLVDFGDVKKATKDACNSLNETFILPGESDVLEIKRVKSSNWKSHEDAMEYNIIENEDTTSLPMISTKSELLPASNNIEIRCPRDGTFFSFPENDCKLLPIVHSTAEELARFLWKDILIRLGGASYLRDKRGVKEMSVFVAERPTQRARYRKLILTGMSNVDVENVIKKTWRMILYNQNHFLTPFGYLKRHFSNFWLFFAYFRVASLFASMSRTRAPVYSK